MQYFAARACAHIDFMLFIDGMRLENDIVFLGLGRPAAVEVASAGIDLVLVIGLRCKNERDYSIGGWRLEPSNPAARASSLDEVHVGIPNSYAVYTWSHRL